MSTAKHIDVLSAAEERVPPAPGPAARGRLRREALELARRESLVDAAYSYRIVALDRPAAQVLHAGGEAFHAPWLLPASGRLTALGCAACTIGPRFEKRVSELFAERRAALALALDELGSGLLFEVSRRVQDHMLAEARRGGLTMAGELRPGDPGLALEAQPGVLRLANAGAIGVDLNESLLMRPHKSTSMVLGVGVGLPVVSWSRCQHCRSRAKCRHGSTVVVAA